ncbi:hypothetical protein D3C80_564630 [compost metagenome]
MQHQGIVWGQLPVFLQAALDRVFYLFTVFAVGHSNHAGDGHADRQTERPAAHLFGHRVHKGNVHFVVGGYHRFADRIERNVQALFFFVQCFGQITDFRHVDIGADHAQRQTLGV